MKTRVVVFLLVAVGLSYAQADTIQMKNGVRIDGRVTNEGKDLITVQIGDRQTVLQTSEVAAIEKNDKTGAFDRQKAEADALAQEQEMVRLTGLTAPQRNEVKRLMELLLSSDESVSGGAYRSLIDMGKEINVFQYFANCLPALMPRYIPSVLEILLAINPAGTKPLLQDEVYNLDGASRAKAIELLGRIQDRGSVPLFVRALIDHVPDVRIAACYALGVLKAREATPMLIENLTAFDLRLQNASRTALQQIWSTEEKNVDFLSATDWQAFWLAQSSSVTPYSTSGLEPLVPPGTQFQDE